LAQPADAVELMAKWARLRELRNPVRKEIETLRAAGKVGSSLQAEVDFYADGADYEVLASLGDDLKFVMLTSAARLHRARERCGAGGRALVGLLTGNVEHGARLKLRSAGLDPARFVVGAFGSDSHHRPDLPAVAARHAAQLTGRAFSGADIVIVGDTPDDVACCKPMGARSVGVATGFYDVPALRAAGATHVFADLTDTQAVLGALLS